MVIVRVMGGLGNQLFQYAAGRRIALANDALLKLDVSLYAVSAHGYRLNRFKVVEDIASASEIRRLTVDTRTGTLARIRRRIGRHMPDFVMRRRMPILRERRCRFSPKVLKAPGEVYLDGYWQSEKYFLEIEDIVREELQLKDDPDEDNRALLEEIRNCESVSLHVRHGDYVSDPRTSAVLSARPPDYYAAAVETVSASLADPRFYVFSDDIEWCREHMRLGYWTTFVTHNGAARDWEDLRLMAACKHHIIANSSFSWWAAWLCPNADKIVIAPKDWFADPGKDSTHIVPNAWRRI